MSDIPADYPGRLNLAELVARIERQQEETRKFVSAQHKLNAEADKLASEARKLDRDRGLARWQVTAITVGSRAGRVDRVVSQVDGMVLMTPTERRVALQSIGWTQRGLADRLGWDEGTVRRWMRDGGEAPAKVDRWLAELARFHDQNPAPVRSLQTGDD